MNVELDHAKRDFKEKMRRDAVTKKMAALRAAKERHKQKKPAQDMALVAVRNALQALTDLIVAQGNAKAGPVKFTVEERDLNGKIKSFKVE